MRIEDAIIDLAIISCFLEMPEKRMPKCCWNT